VFGSLSVCKFRALHPPRAACICGLDAAFLAMSHRHDKDGETAFLSIIVRRHVPHVRWSPDLAKRCLARLKSLRKLRWGSTTDPGLPCG